MSFAFLPVLIVWPCFTFAQPTGTLVDPSVPAGVAPNPHTLDGAQLPATAPTPVVPVEKRKKLPRGNRGNHVRGESFVAPVQSGASGTP